MGMKTTFYLWALLHLFSGESSSDPQCCRSGENVYLHLQNENTSFEDVSWVFSTSEIVGNFKCIFKSSAELFQNGTLKISNIQANWSGEFTATGYDGRGANTVKETHHLLVLDPPEVHLTVCINGTSVFYCANENGHDVTHTWTVNNSALGEETLFNNSNKHVILANMSGTVRCSVEKKGCSFHSCQVYENLRMGVTEHFPLDRWTGGYENFSLVVDESRRRCEYMSSNLTG
ncbi:uncharacterized protein LOC108922975 [Scleropages formosus]|uniref:uncharacterized protein LOC108922975 n=1 Tax=Scleropages formosus TaxID=113540 RepID=UPI000878DA10|nr:uncharacterized protein LOC108922975 [Scleropages formosus]